MLRYYFDSDSMLVRFGPIPEAGVCLFFSIFYKSLLARKEYISSVRADTRSLSMFCRAQIYTTPVYVCLSVYFTRVLA